MKPHAVPRSLTWFCLLVLVLALPSVSFSQIVTSKHNIPVRIIEAHPFTGTGECSISPYHTRDGWYDKIDDLNAVYGKAGHGIWIKSLERRCFTELRNEGVLPWTNVKSELGQVFRGAQTAAWDGQQRSHANWLWMGHAVFGSADEVIIWRTSFPSGHSTGATPEQAATIMLRNGDDLTHEFGHLLGLRHTFDINSGSPDYGGQLRPNWSLIYCSEPTAMRTFTSEKSCDYCAGTLVTKDKRAKITTSYLPMIGTCEIEYSSTRCLGFVTAPNSKYYHWFRQCEKAADQWTCIYRNCYPDQTTGAQTCAWDNGTLVDSEEMIEAYTASGGISSVRALEGISFPPSAPGEIWGANPMTYLLGIHPNPPVFQAAASQNRVARTYLSEDTPMRDDVKELYHEDLDLLKPLLAGVTADMLSTQRDQLGESTEDLLWWSNGDFSFAEYQRPIAVTEYRPVVADFDGNGWDDILWFRPSLGRGYLWFANNSGFFDKPLVEFGVDPDYQAIVGNFDALSGDDIFLYKSGSSLEQILWSNGTRTLSTWERTTLSVSGTYIPLVGNFDGTNGDDIFWYSEAGGFIYAWYSLPGRAFSKMPAETVGDGGLYKGIAGDFEGDGIDDVFWYRAGAGDDCVLWYHGTGGTRTVAASHVGGTYKPYAGDFNGDGKDDLYWDASLLNKDYIWKSLPGRLFSIRPTLFYGNAIALTGDFGVGPAGCASCDDIFWYRQ